MKNFIRIVRSVLLCTLIVVCICACGKDTSAYISSEEKGSSESAEVSTQEISSELEEIELETQETLLYVYICGAVNKPGVYTLPEGSRVCDLFVAAGGLADDAATDYWNQARILVDGEMLYVPTVEEAKERYSGGLEDSYQVADANNASGKINLNTASVEQLMEIPGIGESKARAIINYRDTNGGFSSIEEVMNIEGIKEGVFSKMKEYIVIN